MSESIERILRKKDFYIRALKQKYKGASVLVAMSGGVDSSVAAYLLAEAGLNVIGIHFRLVEYADENVRKGCCHTGTAKNVEKVCELIGAKSYVWNLSNLFQQNVIGYFEKSYLQGETPNPCIECNRVIKWGELWKRKDVLGIEFVATGHYAKIIQLYGKRWITRALDISKDQSYALWVIPEEKRHQTLFPLGNFHKKEIRILAKHEKLPTASTPESQDICFLAGTDYRTWLTQRFQNQLKTGLILTSEGKVVGQHSGVFNYTIGQRKGLGGGFTEPQYVIETKRDTAEVVIGAESELYYKEIWLRDVIGEVPNQEVLVQVRYKDRGSLAKASWFHGDRVRIEFQQAIRAPAIGQSAVAYLGERVVFGGIIQTIQK